MHSLRRLFVAAALLLTLAITLTGCVHLDRNVHLNGDGSGNYTLTLGFSEQMISLAGDTFVSQMNAYGDKIKARGGSYRQYDATGYSYWAYTSPFKSVDQLNEYMKEVPQPGGDTNTLTPTPMPDTTDSFVVTEQPGTFTNTFHMTGHMSLAAPSGMTDLDPSVTSLLKDARESFSVTMPGWVTSHAGGTLSGNTVTYTIHFGESATIDVTGGGVNTSLVYPLIGGAILVVLIVIVVVILLIRARRGRKLEPSPEPVAAAAPVADAGFGDPATPPMPADPSTQP